MRDRYIRLSPPQCPSCHSPLGEGERHVSGCSWLKDIKDGTQPNPVWLSDRQPDPKPPFRCFPNRRTPLNDNCPRCLMREMVPFRVEHVTLWICPNPNCNHRVTETSTAQRQEFEARVRL